MALADDISQAMAEQPERPKDIFPGTVNTVSPLTVTLDGSGVALPCLSFGQVVLSESCRVGVIKLGSDLVVVGSFLPYPPTVTSAVAASTTPNATTAFTSWPSKTGAVFVAPPSGRVMMHWRARIYTIANFGCGSVSVEVRTGDTFGGGVLVLAPMDQYAVTFCSANAGDFITASAHKELTGLTPGNTYAAELQRYGNPLGSVAIDYAQITVAPQL